MKPRLALLLLLVCSPLWGQEASGGVPTGDEVASKDPVPPQTDSKILWSLPNLEQPLLIRVYKGFSTTLVTQGVGKVAFNHVGDTTKAKVSWPMDGADDSGEIVLAGVAAGKTNLLVKFEDGTYLNLDVVVEDERPKDAPLPFYPLRELIKRDKQNADLYTRTRMMRIVNRYEDLQERGRLENVNVHRKVFDFPEFKFNGLGVTLHEGFTFQEPDGTFHQIYTFMARNLGREVVKLTSKDAYVLAGRKETTGFQSIEGYEVVIPDAISIDDVSLEPGKLTTGMIFIEHRAIHTQLNNFILVLGRTQERVATFSRIDELFRANDPVPESDER